MMERHWSSGNDSMWLEDGWLHFDTSGTPLDQDWAIRVEDLLDGQEGRVARAQARRAFGDDALREVLARVLGPTLESFDAPAPAPAPTGPAANGVDGPIHAAVGLMCDVLAFAGLPFPSFAIGTSTTWHTIDGAACEASRWSSSGARDGIEAYAAIETSWWNPHTVAQSSAVVHVADKRAGYRAVTLGSEPPWTTWDLRVAGEPLLPREWFADRLARSGWTLRGSAPT